MEILFLDDSSLTYLIVFFIVCEIIFTFILTDYLINVRLFSFFFAFGNFACILRVFHCKMYGLFYF